MIFGFCRIADHPTLLYRWQTPTSQTWAEIEWVGEFWEARVQTPCALRSKLFPLNEFLKAHAYCQRAYIRYFAGHLPWKERSVTTPTGIFFEYNFYSLRRNCYYKIFQRENDDQYYGQILPENISPALPLPTARGFATLADAQNRFAAYDLGHISDFFTGNDL